MDSVWTQAELAVIGGDQYQIEIGHKIVKQAAKGGPTHYFVVEDYGKLHEIPGPTWCHACRREIETLHGLYRNHHFLYYVCSMACGKATAAQEADRHYQETHGKRRPTLLSELDD